jgi:hypothetical protein
MKKLGNTKYAVLLVLALVMVGCPPYAVIITSPSDGASFEAGVEITFSGSAKDCIEGELSEDSLVWKSDQQGEIGKGKEFTRDDLSEGTHSVTLTATNSLGETAINTITITIGKVTPTTSTTVTNTTTITNTTTTVEPDDRLESNCYNWPEQDFSPTNRADLAVSFDQGDLAVNFTLKDTNGQSYTLFTLLSTKPVMLVFGSFT